MDDFTPQTGGLEVKQGHEESDLSIRGIIISAVVLALAGFLSFGVIKAFLVWGLPPIEARLFPERQLTASQKQLLEEREPKLKEPGRAPDRGDEEARLQRTFPVPRLQYDDVRELDMFRDSEDQWLASSGQDAAGNAHVPVNQAMNAIVEHGLPAVSGSFVPPTLPTAVPMVPATQKK